MDRTIANVPIEHDIEDLRFDEPDFKVYSYVSNDYNIGVGFAKQPNSPQGQAARLHIMDNDWFPFQPKEVILRKNVRGLAFEKADKIVEQLVTDKRLLDM